MAKSKKDKPIPSEVTKKAIRALAAQIKRQMIKSGYDSSQPVVVFKGGCLNGEA